MKLDSTINKPVSEKKYSIIVPHKNSTDLLTRLLDSIPNSPDIEIIIVDDNSNDEEREKLKKYNFDERVLLLFNARSQGAGKARNIALERATGKWLLFADADDFFSANMLSLIDRYFEAEEDIVFFGTTSVYSNNTEVTAFRHTRYLKLVTDYANDGNQENEDSLKYYFNPPWGKLIRRKLVEEKKIRFQEILASNDIFFSITSAYHAKKIIAITDVLYTITVIEGSISNSFTREHFDTRFLAVLTANDFLRSINKSKYQQSVLYYIARSHAFGWKYMLYVFEKIIKHRSNIFIGLKKVVGYKTMLSQRENPSFSQKQ